MAISRHWTQCWPTLGAGHEWMESSTSAILSDTDRGRLVSRLAAVLNPANIQPAQMQAIYADVQAIFQVNGLARKDAVKIVDQVKVVAAETQRSGG